MLSSLVPPFSCDLLTIQVALHFVKCCELVCVSTCYNSAVLKCVISSLPVSCEGENLNTFSFKAKYSDILNAMSSHKVAMLCRS